MSETKMTPARRQFVRLALLTLGLAPVVAFVLLGLFRLQRVIPEWVYWRTELIFLIVLEAAYGVTAVLALGGAVAFGLRFVKGRHSGTSQLSVARGLLLSTSLLLGLGVVELVCTGWVSRSRQFTAVPVGGLGLHDRADPALRFAKPVRHIDLHSSFPDPPGDREIDVVVIGGSSAQGVPYQKWISIGGIIAWKLEEALPGRPVRLKIIATAGDTLERQHQVLSNLTRRPDLLVIYSGHNEFYSRLWWARNLDHYTLLKRPDRWELLGAKLERASSLCVLIRETADRCRIAIPPTPDTSRSLVDTPNFTATEYALLLSDFHNRLEELVSYAEQVGAVPVLILPPANDTDFEPNRSFLPPSTPPDELDAFGREVVAARQLETANATAAIDRYRALVARQPCFAETHYRLATLLNHAGAWDEAYREYVAARDLDGMPMRCPSPFQDAFRQVAARHHGSILIDGQSYFHAIGRHGLLDDELFQDAMHPSLRGQIALAQAVLVALRTRGAFGWPQNSAVPVIDPAECAAHFGIDRSAWRTIALWWKGFNELMSPMRYDPDLRSRKKDAAVAAVARIDAGDALDALGLPNVGVPAAIPVVENPEPAPAPTVRIMPCLEE